MTRAGVGCYFCGALAHGAKKCKSEANNITIDMAQLKTLTQCGPKPTPYPKAATNPNPNPNCKSVPSISSGQGPLTLLPWIRCILMLKDSDEGFGVWGLGFSLWGFRLGLFVSGLRFWIRVAGFGCTSRSLSGESGCSRA